MVHETTHKSRDERDDKNPNARDARDDRNPNVAASDRPDVTASNRPVTDFDRPEESKNIAQREREAKEAKDAAEKKTKTELSKEESERRKVREGGKLSGTIWRVAADLMEQSDRRGREMIERDMDTGTSAEVQRVLILAILMHLDGNLTVSETSMPVR